MKFASVRKTAELYKDIYTDWGLRRLIVNKEKNGFNKCLIRVGKKIIIDLEKFEQWLNEQHEIKN
jgi:hypothetical protein